MNLNQLADRYIPAATNKTVLKYDKGETHDIVQEVLACFRDSKDQLIKFAPYLRGKNVEDTCRNIWNFWKQNITYRVDAAGGQWVQTPAAVWSKKVCDCKSFSVAVASCLYALGIDVKFRFTSYGSNATAPTHVYTVAVHQGRDIIIDCVWNAFNSEKTFRKNWDYYMTAIYRVSGLEPISNKGTLDIDVHDNETSEGELDLALNKQKLEYEQMISRRTHAVGSVTDNAYQTEIEAHNAALGAIKAKKKSAPKKRAAAPKKKAVPAAGQSKRVARKTAKAVKANASKGVNKKQAKLLTKAGKTITKRKVSLLKKVGKGLAKSITTPLRLAAKSQLPKQSPFFLYLFITDPKIIAKLPENILLKRQKALHYKKVLVSKLQMKESNFTSTVRNGIMNNFGKSPENVLAAWMTEWKKTNGIGIVPLAALSAAGGGLKSLLNKLGGNISEDIENFTPAPEDWGTVSEEVAKELATDVAQQPTNNDPGTGNGSVRPTNNEGDYTVKNPATGSGTGYSDEDSDYNNTADPADDPTGELLNTKDLEAVTVTASKTKNGDGNSFLLLAGVGIAALVLSGKK